MVVEKELSDYTLEELQEEFVVIVNVECGREIGLMKQADADEVFNKYKDVFPLGYEPLISPEREDMITENIVVPKEALKENIYEEIFGEDYNLKKKYR